MIIKICIERYRAATFKGWINRLMIFDDGEKLLVTFSVNQSWNRTLETVNVGDKYVDEILVTT